VRGDSGGDGLLRDSRPVEQRRLPDELFRELERAGLVEILGENDTDREEV